MTARLSPLAPAWRRGGWRGSRRRGGRSTEAWTPQQLSSLRAWYDAELGQPKYGGAGAYVQLDGTSGDYVYTPDSAALDAFDGDIEVVMRVWCANWATGSSQTLAGRYVTSTSNRCFRFYVSGVGAVVGSGSPDGAFATVVSPAATPTNPLPTSTWFWLRMRLDLSDGVNSVMAIDTAADTGSNYLEPISWTANGSGVAAIISGIYTGTAPMEIGSFSNGTLERFTGRVGRMIARDGFDGTTVADFNASNCYGDGYWHTGGYRWNLGLPKIYDRSGNNVAPATFGSGSNQPQWLPWTGRSRVYLPGVSGNYVSGPNVDHSGDFTARVQLNYRSAGLDNPDLITDRDGSTGEAAFRLTGGTGVLDKVNLLWWESGPTARNINGGSHGLVDGQDAWLGVERINDSGGVYRVRFYKSVAESPSMSDWSDWTLISEHNGAAVAAPVPSSVGSSIGGPNVHYLGSIYRVVTTNDEVQTVDFDAALCGQSGYTDSLGNVWSVLRATSGRKTVVQSPVANSARSLWLYGTDDQASTVAAAAPALGTTDAATFGVVGRNHANRQSFARHLSVAAGATEAIQLGEITTGNNSYYYLSDGTNIAQGGGPALPQTVRAVRTLRIDGRGAGKLVDTINANAAVTANTSTVGAVTATAIRLGASATSGGNADDGEIEAMFTLDRAISDTEHGQLVAYYRGGL